MSVEAERFPGALHLTGKRWFWKPIAKSHKTTSHGFRNGFLKVGSKNHPCTWDLREISPEKNISASHALESLMGCSMTVLHVFQRIQAASSRPSGPPLWTPSSSPAASATALASSPWWSMRWWRTPPRRCGKKTRVEQRGMWCEGFRCFFFSQGESTPWGVFL